MPKEKIQSAGGIGDSKVFVAPEDQRVPSGVDRMMAAHINGQLISDLNLGPEVLAALDWYATDEGIAEKNARPNVVEPSGIELGADGFTKALQQKKDDVLERGYDSYEARDPLREVAEQYAKPGMRPKFLSEKKTKDGGNRDYEIVKDAKGDPVKVRGMLLGHIPETMAVARNRHYQRRGGELLKQLNEKYKSEGGPTAVSDQDLQQ
jgi:hypothetical protein